MVEEASVDGVEEGLVDPTDRGGSATTEGADPHPERMLKAEMALRTTTGRKDMGASWLGSLRTWLGSSFRQIRPKEISTQTGGKPVNSQLSPDFIGSAATPSHDALVDDLKVVRREGSKALTTRDLPAIDSVCRMVGLEPSPAARQDVLERAADLLGPGGPGEAARHILGIHEETLGLPADKRRKKAAALYESSDLGGGGPMDPITFSREREPQLLAELALKLMRLVPVPPPPPHRSRWVLVTGAMAAMVAVAILVWTLWPTKSKVLLSYDFEAAEQDHAGWGEHPSGGIQEPGKGVERLCGQQASSGSGACSLRFVPTDATDRDVYVTVREDASRSTITARVFAPPGASTCTVERGTTACSTVRIIIFDRGFVAHESDYVELVPGKWQTVSWNLGDEQWPSPWQDFGVHFFLRPGVSGPFFVDDVTARR